MLYVFMLFFLCVCVCLRVCVCVGTYTYSRTNERCLTRAGRTGRGLTRLGRESTAIDPGPKKRMSESIPFDTSNLLC